VNLIYQVKVGETPAFYDTCIASVARYCEKYQLEHVVQSEPILKIRPVKSARSANALRLGYLPIYEKSVAFSYLDRYEKIAVIDADIYIRPSAPNLFDELKADFAAVLERDMPLTEAYFTKIRKYSEGQYRPLSDVDWQWSGNGAAFFNMGLMLFGRGVAEYLNGTPGEFLRRPEFERFVNGEGHWKWSTDQTLLNYWVRKSGMDLQALDWKWNALYGGVRDEVLSQAYFVHFFLAAKMAQGGAEIPGIIRRL
jgi:hypothetical protein